MRRFGMPASMKRHWPIPRRWNTCLLRDAASRVSKQKMPAKTLPALSDSLQKRR
jgi:hypothetical protein